MATIKLGGGIADMRGSIGGYTFARNRNANYIRNKTKPVNPNSVLQQTVRSIIGYLTQRWHDTITSSQRTAWGVYANAVAMKNKVGETTYLSGFNHYIRVNAVRLQMENSKCDAGPVTLSLPEKDPTLTIVAYASTQKIHVARDTTLPWCAIPASIMGVWMGSPQIVTRNFFAGPWKKMGSIPGNGVSPTEMTPPFVLITGQKIWCYARIATGPTDSRLSEPMVVSCIVAAAPP